MAQRTFSHAPKPWIDLSTGINPLAYPVGAVSDAAWRRLPEQADLQLLEAAAATAYGAHSPDTVVAAPGTQALLQLLPRLRARSHVAVLSPTYGEHAHVWRQAGHHVEDVSDISSLRAADVAIVVNPNNPDGRLITTEELRTLASAQAARGGLLIVDEAFADVDEERSIVPWLSSETRGIIVLRSFGKFYGLAGIRLGFAIADEETVESIRAGFGPWAVSGPTIEIGRQALEDDAWREATRLRLRRDSERLADMLANAGFRVVGGTSLFLLAEAEDAQARYNALGAAGILTRRFPYAPRWLRFGLPGLDVEWTRLGAALGA